MPKRKQAKAKPLNTREELKLLNEKMYTLGLNVGRCHAIVLSNDTRLADVETNLGNIITPLALVRGSILALDQDREASTNIQEEINKSLDLLWKAQEDAVRVQGRFADADQRQNDQTERLITLMRLMLRRLMQLEAPKVEAEALDVIKRLVELRRKWQTDPAMLGDRDHTASHHVAWAEAQALVDKSEGK